MLGTQDERYSSSTNFLGANLSNTICLAFVPMTAVAGKATALGGLMAAGCEMPAKSRHIHADYRHFLNIYVDKDKEIIMQIHSEFTA